MEEVREKLAAEMARPQRAGALALRCTATVDQGIRFRQGV